MPAAPLSRPFLAPEPAGLRRARMGLVAAWAAVALVHLALGPVARSGTWPLGYLLLEGLASAGLGWRALRSRGRGRRAWGLLAASAALEVPNLLLLFLTIRGVLGAWTRDVSNLLTLGTGLLVLAGVLSFPRGPEPGGRLMRRALDGLIFAASLLFLLWLMGLQASLQDARGLGLRVVADYLNAALLGGGLVFMISDEPGRARGPLGWLGGSALAWLAGLSWWALSGLQPTQGAGAWLAVVGAIPLFQGLAACSPREVEPSEPAPAAGPRVARLLPYAPAVAAVGVLALLLPRAPLDLMRGAFGIFLLLVALLLFRQFQAIRDLQQARRTLEDRVRERTRALEQAQDTLLRTERLNTLALMGAGVAHDLNNLLGAVKAAAELAALRAAEGSPPEGEELARIATTAERAASLTQRLMGFVRREVEAPEILDLQAELAGMEPTLRLLVPRSVDLQIALQGSGSCRVHSSRARLEQMLVNLVANAADAMPAGGHLAVRLEPLGPDPAYAAIAVADSGSGMTPEVLARIFDPFFTTKPPGKGTGLGLPSLKALVEEAEGRLEVESEPGVGTCFRILLPRLGADRGS